jgi:low temperature requirement protein LtrA
VSGRIDAVAASPGKRVGFLELFFDLVFVFAVTQLVGLLHDDHAAQGWVRAGLLLWLVWWAWSQYTWAGNAIDLDRRPTRLAVLAVAGAMLLAATAMPVAYSGQSLWFVVPYTSVRLAGLTLYWYGLRGNPEHRNALRTYVPVAVLSPLIVLAGGVAGGDRQVWLWTLAITIDLASVVAAGRGEFQIDPAHFAERHGLIVIIALGEAVIAAGATAAEVGLESPTGLVLAAGFATAAAMWWCYFDWIHPAAEHRLVAEPDARRRGRLARDLYTLGHLPIVAGIVLVAAAVEEGLLHPTDELNTYGTATLAAGTALYLGGFVAGNLRATGRLLTERIVGLVAATVWVLTAGPRVPVVITFTGVAVGIAVIATTEAARRSTRASGNLDKGGAHPPSTP